ncbi:hypothetical protein [Nonomuraea africana]|uniref:Histidine kinase n=1 Tax=Nonomuraea africana TaxID=46171 RepID=A0ABR9KWV8_9ACTN|nr:hypothetical protein [Nonomuraea africana]MBE1566528.1 hypothetical protein [Nonomuraea africana]
MTSDRVVLVALAVVAAISIATALLLADGSTWPAALLGGLAAGGATLWGMLGWLSSSP